MKAVAVLAGIAVAACVATIVITIVATGREWDAGFIGPGTLLTDLNLLLQGLLVLGLTAGMWLARAGRIEAHRINQTIWVLVNTVLIVLVMIGSMQNVHPAAIADLADPRVGFAWLHAAIGAATAASGLWLVLQMNDILPASIHIQGWKTMMRLTLAGYWASAIAGIGTYFAWHMR